MIETKNIRNLYAENMDDDLDKIISLDFLKNNDISGGSTLGGTQYLFVSGSGTPEENGAELLEAYEAAENMPRYLGLLYANSYYNLYKGQTYFIQGPNVYATQTKDEFSEIANASQNVIEKEQAEATKTTILIAPGTYKFSTTFEANLSGVRLSSITGEMDVIIDGNINQTKDDQEFIGLDLRNNTFSINSINTNSVYKNISALGDNSFSSDENDIDGTFYKCVGGVSSFCGNYYTSGNFYNCMGGTRAFSGEENTNGNFYDCIGGIGSFGGVYETSGNFHNCVGAAHSFGSGSIVSGNFYNCTGGDNSFGSGGVSISGTFYNCIGGIYSFGSNTYNNLTSSARLYYCKLISGTFTTPNPGGKLVLCIDGNDNIITTGDTNNTITPIYSMVFEKGLEQNAVYDWRSDLTIDEEDDVYFISSNTNVATVTTNGIVTMLSDDAQDFAEIIAIGNTSKERLLVCADGYNVFKFYHATADDFNIRFSDGDCYLVKPDKTVKQLVDNVDEACGVGECYLIFDSSCTEIDINNNHISGKIRTLYINSFTCSFNQLVSLWLPNAGNVDCKYNQLTYLNAPNATSVNCAYNQITSLNLPNATYAECADNALLASNIASLLAMWRTAGAEGGYAGLTDGTNAPVDTWSAQAILDREYLVNTKSWDIYYNLTL